MKTERHHRSPPVASKVAKTLVHHDVVRMDNYFWLRDDARADKTVRAHLEAENRYCSAMLAHTKALQEELYQEMVGRLDTQQASVPVKHQQHYYWQSYTAAAQYPQFWRAQSIDGAEKTLILDANQRALQHHFYQLAPLVVSEDEHYVALAEDTRGDNVYAIRIKNLLDGSFLPETLQQTSGQMVWGNTGHYFYYVKLTTDSLLGYQVYRHDLGTLQSQDTLVYEEEDHHFYTYIAKSKDKSLVFVYHRSTETSAVSALDAELPNARVQSVIPKEHGHQCWGEKRGDEFFMLTNWQAKNFRLVKVPLQSAADKSCWQTLVETSAEALLEDMQLFDNHLVYLSRQRGLPVYRVKSLVSGKEFSLKFNDQAFSAYFKDNPAMSSSRVRLCYDSLTVPDSIIEFDLDSGQAFLLQQEAISGGFLPEHYQSEHVEFCARDGEKVPVTLVYRKDRFRHGENPLYLEGYGAYGLNIDAQFRVSQLSLLDRGFVCAFAHIRGSSMLGWHWYEQGKLFNKLNTFNDFIDVTHALIQHGYAAKDKVFAVGESAGGLMIAAVINQAPGLYKACAAHVPFVDIVTSMLDASLPLTTREYDEWGDPNKKSCFDYMLSYSPYDQVKAQEYPHLFVTAGFYDAQVQYFEPAKWVAKLREYKTDPHQLLFQIDMDAGHSGVSGRFDKFRQVAVEYAFFLSLLE